MANRVIKPDASNDLLLQNNGGGTSIEIPDSGNIEITGTIGSGTIGSSVIFPSGHIVQTKESQIQKAVTPRAGAGSFAEIDSDLRINFTPVSASNKLVFIFHAGNAIAENGDLQVKIMYNSSSDTAPDTSFSGNAVSSLRQGNAEITQVHHMCKENAYSGTRCISPTFGSSNSNTVSISNSTYVTFFMIHEIIP